MDRAYAEGDRAVTRALRIDDIGAASKRWEIWSRHRWANATPLKWLYPFKAWGPYRELAAWELDMLCGLVDGKRSRLTLAITACWVERDGTLVPYPEKFPRQAEVILKWVRRGTVEVANHGLTHCRVGQHLPRWWRGNREMHREFTDAMSRNDVARSLGLSQSIFERWLGLRPRVLVPPGLQFPEKFYDGLGPVGLRVWTREDEARCLTYHDRDFVCGDGWGRFRAAIRAERFTTCGMVM